MERLLKIRKRAKHEIKPICPVCRKSPTSRHWSDDWLYWHQIHWCKVLQQHTQQQLMESQGAEEVSIEHDDMQLQTSIATDYEAEEQISVDHQQEREQADSQASSPARAFPFSFSFPLMYRTRSQAAVEETSQKASENAATSSSAGVTVPADGDDNRFASKDDAANIGGYTTNSANDPAAYVHHNRDSYEDSPVDLIEVSRYILERRRTPYDHADQPMISVKDSVLSSAHRQPSSLAVKQFLSAHPQANHAAVDDLLRLIKYLVSPDMLMYTAQLPVTRDALWREIYDSIDSSMTLDKSTSGTEKDVYTRDPSRKLGLQVSQIRITEDYFVQFPHFDILAVLTDLILQRKLTDNDDKSAWNNDYTKSYYGNEEPDNLLYHEISSGAWWREIEQEIHRKYGRSPRKHVLAVIPYLDGVSVDFFESVNMIPWVITLGNIQRCYRNKLSSKRLIAFIPNPSDEEIRLKVGVKGNLSSIRQEIMNKCIEIVLAPLETAQRNGGFTIVESLLTSSSPVTYYPAIPFFIGDNKEQGHLAGVRLNDFLNRAGNQLRKRQDVQHACMQKDKHRLLKDLSVVEDIDKFYLFQTPSLFGLPERESSFYESFPPDNLHSLYAGIIRYSVSWTLDLVKAYAGMNTLYEIDTIFLQRYRCGSSLDAEFKFIVPKKSISKIAKLTRTKDSNMGLLQGHYHQPPTNKRKNMQTDEASSTKTRDTARASKSPSSNFRSLDWGAVLIALTFLIGSSPEGKFLPSSHRIYGPMRDIVTRALVSVVHLLFELQRTEYTEKGIRDLEYNVIPRTLTYLYEIYTLRRDVLKKDGDFNGIKLHLAVHLPHLIRRFGCPLNWDTDTFESSHKDFVKKHWESGPKRTEDLELNALKSYKFWCDICELSGINCNGRMIPTYALKEKFTRTIVRRWRRTNLEGDAINREVGTNDAVVYKFTKSGYDLAFREHDEEHPLSVRSRFEVILPDRHNTSKTAIHGKEDSFKAHNLVQSKLLELLFQFAEIQDGNMLSSAFQSREHISLKHLRMCLHESITIRGDNAMEGYSDFKIYATNKWGTSSTVKKCRYDVVEVTIPLSSGGAIAGASDLMRISDDTAVAKVLGILTLHYYEREMCLLFLQFMKSTFPRQSGSVTRHIKKYLGLGCNLYYGRGHSNWIALYPLLTLKGPALEILDPYHAGYSHVLTMKFVCRGGWWPESSSFLEEEDLALPMQRESSTRQLLPATCIDDEGKESSDEGTEFPPHPEEDQRESTFSDEDDSHSSSGATECSEG